MPGSARPQSLPELFQILQQEGLTPIFSEFEGDIFHGTTVDGGREIIRINAFIPTGNIGRYGPGVYFYDFGPVSGLVAAKDWAENSRDRQPDDKPAVVVARFRSARIFDMTTPANAKYVNRLTLLFTQLMERLDPAKVSEINEQKVGKLIASLAPERAEIQAIRGVFKLPKLSVSKQKGLVIREQSCIFDFRLIENFP